MDETEFRRLLKSIGDQILHRDLQHMKYLCHDKVEAAQLQRAESAIELFNLLLTRDLIGPTKLEFLEYLLDKSQRKDLVGRIRTSGRDVASEGPVNPESTPDTRRCRVFLNQLSDELTIQDLESLKFLIGVPAATGEHMKTGHHLFDYLEKRRDIRPSNLNFLKENFNHIHRKDLSKKINTFFENELDEQRNTTESTINREQTATFPILPLPSPKLLTPQHFEPSVILPATVPPVMPNVSLGPRYPVQCGEDLSPLDEEDEMPSYPMTNRPRGFALIISNETFQRNSSLSPRTGTEKDVGHLKNLWEKLHFEVVIERDKTANEMYDIIRDFSSKDHSNYDCFVCCLLSHGIHGCIYGSDSELLELGLITSQFKGTACRSLLSKPKLFFIQACRGRDFDHGAQPDAVRNSEEDAMRQSAEPNEGHFLLGYATPPGYVSWRSMEHGSWYISKLCEVFGKYCETYDVTSMMVKVNDEVSEAYTKRGYKQCPAPVVTLRKRIYLNNN